LKTASFFRISVQAIEKMNLGPFGPFLGGALRVGSDDESRFAVFDRFHLPAAVRRRHDQGSLSVQSCFLLF
jgi:hypothetical protein